MEGPHGDEWTQVRLGRDEGDGGEARGAGHARPEPGARAGDARARRSGRGRGGPGRGIGREVADFRLVDVRTGLPVALADFGDRRAVVLAFSGVDCPLGNLAMPRLVRLAETYRDRGVAVLALNANAHDTAEQIVANAREHGVGFPVLKDAGNAVADRLQVERIGEVLVLDGHRRLRYRGAIDDRDSLRGRKGEAMHNYLADALDAVLAGRPVATAETPVAGCLIDRASSGKIRPPSPILRDAFRQVEAEDEGSIDVGPVTFAADVAPILQAQVPVVPPSGSGRAVLLAVLRPGEGPRGDDPRGGRRPADAPVARRSPIRDVRQRPEPDASRTGHAAGLGRSGDAAGQPRRPAPPAHVPGGVEHRHARRRPGDGRAVRGPGRGGAAVPEVPRPVWVRRGQVGAGGRGPPGRPRRGPPHHGVHRRKGPDPVPGPAQGGVPGALRAGGPAGGLPGGFGQAHPRRGRARLRGPLHADRAAEGRSVEPRADLRQGAGTPRGGDQGDRARRTCASPRATRTSRSARRTPSPTTATCSA